MRIDIKDNGIMIWFKEKDLIFLVKIKWFMGIFKILKKCISFMGLGLGTNPYCKITE